MATSNFTVGQKVIYLHNRPWSKADPVTETVISVGSKYAAIVRHGKKILFHRDTGIENVENTSWADRIYAPEVWAEKARLDAIEARLKELGVVSTPGSFKLTSLYTEKALEQVIQILDEGSRL